MESLEHGSLSGSFHLCHKVYSLMGLGVPRGSLTLGVGVLWLSVMIVAVMLPGNGMDAAVL